MEYRITYDTQGRLRVRMGHSIFTLEEGFGIASLIKNIDNVIDVKPNHYSGSLLIEYTGDKQDILDVLDTLDSNHLPSEKITSDYEVEHLNNKFFNELSKLVINHYLRKLYLPSSIRTIFIVKDAFHYWSNGLKALKDKQLNVAVLDASAISASLYLKDFSSASSIMFLLKIADILEDYIKDKANYALADSLALNIENVWLFKDDQEHITPITKIKIGDNVKIRVGSVIPLDGHVIHGQGTVNESSMTGESIGVLKSIGSQVYAGSVVEEGYIIIKVSSLAYNSRIHDIVRQIQESESTRANVQGQAESLADSIVPYSFIASLVIYGFTRNISKALSVLMVDFSCAIKLTTPISIVAATRDASHNQIIVKGGKHLESFAKADTIVFDKTGTLTTSQPIVSKIITFNNYTEKAILHMAACLEEHYPFSLAKTIVEYAKECGIDHSREIHSELEYIVAHGISSSINGRKVLIGSQHFIFEDENIPLSEEMESYIKEETFGYSNIYLALAGQLAGIICIEDPVRLEAKATIETLKTLGITNTLILTGDEEAIGSKIAKEVGIENYYTRVTPEQKGEMIKKLKEEGKTIIMVGDGVNDTLALSFADVSIAMGDGSELAKEISDITLNNDSLESLVELRKLSVACFNRINQNYTQIVGFNSLLLGLGLSGILSNHMLSVLHNGATVAIGANSAKKYTIS